MKRSVRYSALSVALLTGSLAHGRELANFDAYSNASPAATSPQRVTKGSPAGAVTSTDERRGVPRFLWGSQAVSASAALAHPSASAAPRLAPGSTPEAAARSYLRQFARAYQLSPAALDTAVVRQVHDIGRGGILVALGQEVDGVPLFHSDVKVLMKRDLSLVAISGSLHPSATPLPAGATSSLKSRAFSASPGQAITRALHDLYSVDLKPSDLTQRAENKGGYLYFDLAGTSQATASGLRFLEPARARKVLFPLPDRLVPGYFIEVIAAQGDDTEEHEAVAYVIAADDGRLLYRENLQHAAAYNYRVWADPTGLHVPLDGPQADFTPHPTGVPDGSAPPFIAPILVTMDGFNTNPNGTFDPWLAAGATSTRGNNVDAYADHYNPDGFSNGDTRASTTSSGTFDRTYNTSASPLADQNQIMAAATQIFYVTNWLHDWWYDSGFDEASGNAQQDNFGRGGLGGDRLLAEAQDNAPGNSRNNANMDAASDGTSPRMQMYLWSAPDLERTLNLSGFPGGLQVNSAPFGQGDYDLSAQVVLAVDGANPVNDACTALTNGAQVAGKIALIDRGTCQFVNKVQNAQNAGAAGVIIANNAPGEGPTQLGGAGGGLTIPVMGVSYEDGVAAKALLMNGGMTGTMHRLISPVERDGTIDNTIVAHEWGHYIHLRLVQGCGNKFCSAESEGWGDFNALMMVLREEDDPNGVYPLAGYGSAVYGEYYFGIRRTPYSVDFTKNAMTFRHISDGEALPAIPINYLPDNTEVHNAGEIWAGMLWEAYIALVNRSKQPNPPYNFAEAKRRMSDYVVAGLKLAPPNPTYLEQRDAILAAAFAADLQDYLTLAQGFARRGAGSCAKSPPSDSEDFVGVVEGFDVKAEVDLRAVKLDDSVFSCDSDGYLDSQETGKVTLEIMNTGTGPLTDAVGDVSTSIPGVTFPNGPSVSFGTIQPFATGTATIDIALDAGVTNITDLDLTVNLTSDETCTPTQATTLIYLANFDELPKSSTLDDVQAESTTWKVTGDVGDAVWSRAVGMAPNKVWHGIDFPGISDTSLESPLLQVSPTDALTIKFSHRHKFEFSQNTRWDGGVIEISTDEGATWQDVSTLGQPGYNGTIDNQAGNPLSGRQAYTNQNPAWPNMDAVAIDLGTALAGQTIKVRFRIGTDEAAGEVGWDIDDIELLGITNKPFSTVVDDVATCQGVPVADAGPDQKVPGNLKVALDASGSSDPENDPLTFTWTQVAGPSVDLTADSGPAASFTSPVVDAETTLTFQVTVSDGKASASDEVNIVVTTDKIAPLEIDDGCGCSVVGGDTGRALSPLAAMAALALLRRRRRTIAR